MSSQNFPRVPRNPRVKYVRVDRLTNEVIREAESWNNSRVFFTPTVTYQTKGRDLTVPSIVKDRPWVAHTKPSTHVTKIRISSILTRTTCGANHQFKTLTFVITPERTALIPSANRILGPTRLTVNFCRKMNFMVIRQEKTKGQNTKTRRGRLIIIALGGHRVASILTFRGRTYPL
jgi:hypothetical protein